MRNIILQTDFYKCTHWKQYPKGTTKVYSYLESRGGQFPHTVFFGLQYYLTKYLSGKVLFKEDIDEAKEIYESAFGHTDYFNEEGWRRILEHHGGSIPVRIKAVPEGTIVPVRNVLMTIENTDTELPWITNFVETLLLKVWYPTTVATLSHEIKSNIDTYARATGSEVSEVSLNDFGYRGVSSEESAAIGGMAHLTSFLGTDTIAAVVAARRYYGADNPGASVMASEHSTTTIYGQQNEKQAILNFIEAAGPSRIVSVVSDSWDYFGLVQAFCDDPELRQAVRKHGETGGRVVIRPDSGRPEEIVIKTLEILEKTYTPERNKAGFKELPPEIGIIYGDGINYYTIDKICRAMVKSGWAVSSRNIVFGMGGGLLQQLDRDTQKFAIKCSYAEVDGEARDVYKKPATDKTKDSKRGRLKLIQDSYKVFRTVREEEPGEDLMREVFLNGKILHYTYFGEVKDNIRNSELNQKIGEILNV
jgi:nicotinamide phosphoribosyltransferase